MLTPLALTGFFETYDVALLTLAAPTISEGLGIGIGTFAVGVALIRLATLLSVPVLRLADVWGRRLLLYLSLGIFTLATGATALAVGLISFVVLQMVARVFLATETALAGLVITEEFRPHRRGAGLGVLGILSGVGFGAVGGMLLLVPLTPLDWRLFYLVALLPLGIVAYLRRNLRETRAFEAARREDRIQRTFWPRVGRHQRATLLRAIGVVGAFGLVQTATFFYASDMAQSEYGWSGWFTTIVVTAGVFGILGFYLGGRVSDRVGRKPMVAVAILLATAGTLLMFTAVRELFVPGFYLATLAAACFLAVTVAYIAELFPTEIRATLTAFVIGCQVAAGSLGLAVTGAIESAIGAPLQMLVLGAGLPAALLFLRRLPEVGGCDLLEAPAPEPALPAHRPRPAGVREPVGAAGPAG